MAADSRWGGGQASEGVLQVIQVLPRRRSLSCHVFSLAASGILVEGGEGEVGVGGAFGDGVDPEFAEGRRLRDGYMAQAQQFQQRDEGNDDLAFGGVGGEEGVEAEVARLGDAAEDGADLVGDGPAAHLEVAEGDGLAGAGEDGNGAVSLVKGDKKKAPKTMSRKQWEKKKLKSLISKQKKINQEVLQETNKY